MIQSVTHIARLFLLVCLLATQWTSVVGRDAVLENQSIQKESSSEQEESIPTFEEWFVSSLVPSHQFHFDEVTFDWPELSWGIVLSIKQPTTLPQGNYSHVYFAKIFERLIAINAP